MAVFGRRTARQRLRKATRQALSVPTFRTPDDCTPWVLGGLWPAELNQLTAETATVAEYLKRDLERIADSANHKLRAIGEAGMPDPVRQAEQSRVINVARAFAVLRVESTVRQLRKEPLGFAQELTSLPVVPEEPTRVMPVEQPTQVIRAPRRAPAEPEVPAAQPAPAAPPPPPAQPPPPPQPDAAQSAHAEPTVVEAVPEVVSAEPPAESDQQRLRRVIDVLARQEPGLRWAAGVRADGSTVLATDLAYGWIPPGITLPAGVDLLPPGRRRGSAKAMLGPTEASAVYTPGDPFGRGAATPQTGRGVRRAPAVDDLGWLLAEATRWRNGLPRITHTLAKAAASGTGVVDSELDVLRVHLDTARYQLVARYPEIDMPVLSNCLLLAATEALATGERDAANYHFAWFQALTTMAPAD